ncbi:hypothetical protein BLNAU_17764 [Blattamonas nauphoetae]|uniref:Uncharacterized protein n=1 Tax=Blattamonas nauphoetae TaxID=2049346 RepID=A0ABQ9X679_9EUKA|nr:hypothetical protein BLNAU_17764 [Blattamonas nauphoetae]
MDSTPSHVLVAQEHPTNSTLPHQVINLIDEGLGQEQEDELNQMTVDTSPHPSHNELSISKVKRLHSTATSSSEEDPTDWPNSTSDERQTSNDIRPLLKTLGKNDRKKRASASLPSITDVMSSAGDAVTRAHHTLLECVEQLQSDLETSNQIVVVQQEQIRELNEKLEASNSEVETLKTEIGEARTSVDELQNELNSAQSAHEIQISSLSSQLSQISEELRQVQQTQSSLSTTSDLQAKLDELNARVDDECLRKGQEFRTGNCPLPSLVVSPLLWLIQLVSLLLLVHLFSSCESLKRTSYKYSMYAIVLVPSVTVFKFI